MTPFHDAHCHLVQYKNVDEIITQAIENDVYKIIAVSMFEEEFQKILELHNKYPKLVVPALGIHPIAVSDKTDIEKLLERVEKQIIENLKVLKIIGEIGIDKYFSKDADVWKKQREIFEKILEIAEDNELGVSIHAKYAEVEIMDILDKYNINPTIIHWYSANKKSIKRGIANKYYYSVNLSIEYSKNVQDLVILTPIDQLLTESDGPVKYKQLNLVGKPHLMSRVVKNIAKLKKLQFDEVKISLHNNFKKIIKE